MRLSRFPRLPRLLAAFVALAVPAALAVGSCGLVLDDFEKVAGAPVDAGADVDAAPTGCQSITYPDPPAGTDNPSDAIEFTGAVRSIDLGEGGDKSNPVGINLDKFCTCIDEGPSCKDPPFAADEDHCDDKGGVDNAASRLFSALSLALSGDKFGSAFYSNKAEEGFWTLLIRVTGYNGELDDPRVTVAIYGPAGLQGSSMSGMGNTDGGGGAGPSDPCETDPDAGPLVETIPCWNGHDVWRVADTSVDATTPSIDKPLYFDPNAYVSKGFLVASVSETTLSLGGKASYLGIKLTAGTIVGAVQAPQADGLGFRLVNGTLAARWTTKDIFQTLSTFSTEGKGLCTNNDIYPLFKGRVCGFVDISSKLGGATLECDAISFGMRFNTFPVKLGDIAPVLKPMPTCPPEFDPANDTCGP